MSRRSLAARIGAQTTAGGVVEYTVVADKAIHRIPFTPAAALDKLARSAVGQRPQWEGGLCRKHYRLLEDKHSPAGPPPGPAGLGWPPASTVIYETRPG